MLKKIFIYIFIASLSSIGTSCVLAKSDIEKAKITQVKAVEIANNKFQELGLGYDIKSMNIDVGKYNTPSNKYILESYGDSISSEIKSKLKGKEYWAVYYYPRQLMHGGDVCIFVDAVTGEVLAYFYGA